ncbi:cupin domain-containing protein [uncultured Microbacterium sp.]|uniref:cupin domain-containing protein n=1 Tax=uncultured Microbacterium sp. TaxID=191216 RepID=UPI0025EAD62F|nr:cupin domain-containing protein [uncultured Microbacterium sp.]
MGSNSFDVTVVRPDEIRLGTGASRRFEGAAHGAGVSYFFVDNQPGQGSRRHWHPYPETWVVLEGDAAFTVGDRTVTAAAGDTVIGPAFVPHRFENVGTSTLRLLCIHASDTIIQTVVD